MRLACPNCQAIYDIPDALLGAGGRRLRCARCAADWVADPAAALDAPAASVAPAPVSPAPVSPAPVSSPPGSPVGADSLAERAMDAAAPAPGRSPAKPDSATIKNDPFPSIPGAARASLVPGTRGEARPAAARPPARRPGVAVVAFAWVLSFAVLGGAAAAAYVWRANVMAAWPQSERLYAALGLR